MNSTIYSACIDWLKKSRRDLKKIKNKPYRKRTRWDYFTLGRLEAEIYVMQNYLDHQEKSS